MRKHIVRMIAVLSVVAVALTFVGVVRAQEGAAAPKAAKPAKTPSAAGVITAVDAKAGTLSIKKSDDTVLNFTIAKDCKVTTAKDATVADLKVGDKVVVGYSEEAGAMVAKKIGAPKPKAPKGAPKKDAGQ